MRFTKMQGAGNDYIYVDCFAQSIPDDPAGLSRKLSDRHFGIGGDGLILICPSDNGQNDARMRMFNADGSEGEMCGNGIRCVAKYLFDRDIVRKDRLRIETGRGPLTLDVESSDGIAQRVRVNMGAPILEARKIPTTLSGDPPINAEIEVAGRVLRVTCVSMGNPHAVTYVDDLSDEWVFGTGPKVERHPAFPSRTNVHFVKVISPSVIHMRVWERGSGETLACGTGACAVCVAGVLTDRTGRKLHAHLAGGELVLEWSERDNCVYMTGPAVEIFSGEVDL